MPFTLAHPAAVLPLRRGLVFSALVVGSMTPDFRYFLVPFTARAYESHTLTGVFTFCLPVGLVVLWAFHRVMKRPLLALFPESHQRKLVGVAEPFPFGPLPRFALILFSLFLGSITHIVWDGFTHGSGWAVTRLWFLQTEILNFHRHHLYVFGLLQQGGSILGLLILLLAYEKWRRAAPAQELDPALKIGRMAKVLVVLSILLLATAADFLERWHDTYFPLNSISAGQLVFRTIVSFLGLVPALLFLFSIGWYGLRMNRAAAPRAEKSAPAP